MFGVYTCVKVNSFSLRMFASVFVVMMGLCSCSEDYLIFLGTPHLFGPSEALVNSIETFKCKVLRHPKNESVRLQLLKKGNRTKFLGESTSLAGEAGAFNLVVKRDNEGSLECVARAQNNSNIAPTVSNTHYLKVVESVEDAQIVVLSGPVEFFEGQKLELLCILRAGNYVSYKWLLNDRLIHQSAGLPTDNRLLINRTTLQDSGSYKCVASNNFNTTVFNSTSHEVVITVKGVVSAPDISYTVLKENSHNYFAVVTCESTTGTPPVNFSLYNRAELVANKTSRDRSIVFKVPLVLDRHLGNFQCQANNGHHVAYSQRLPIEVVSVGGPVTLHYDSDIGENLNVVGLRLYCKVAKGSYPRYQWFLNKTLLHDRGTFYYVVNQQPEQSILLMSVASSFAGTYHCEVSDSFDNTTAISSRKLYLVKKVLNHLPVFIVAVVFGCFIALIILVSVFCGLGVVYRRSQYGKTSLSSLEMESMVAAYEGELDESDYNDDVDVVTTVMSEFDQASEASVDEWPQMAEGKMLEDEPVEAP